MENFIIKEEPLDVEEVRKLVVDPKCGGIVIFVGTAREFTDNKRTLYLVYDAYKEMAERMLADIGAEIMTQYPDTKVAIHHRIGRLEITDIAVVIAVAAPHRVEAFSACRYAIEKIKKDVPIWKKEFYSDGSSWVENFEEADFEKDEVYGEVTD